MTVRLPLVVGFAKAMELIITGRRVDAAEALQIGLVNEVVPRGQALARAQELAREIAELPQGAIRSDKESMVLGVGRTLEERLRLEAELILSMFMRRDSHAIGASAFKEKRAARLAQSRALTPRRLPREARAAARGRRSLAALLRPQAQHAHPVERDARELGVRLVGHDRAVRVGGELCGWSAYSDTRVPPVSPMNAPYTCSARAIVRSYPWRPSASRSRLGSSWSRAPSGMRCDHGCCRRSRSPAAPVRPRACRDTRGAARGRCGPV